jgi:hypothetical protein
MYTPGHTEKRFKIFFQCEERLYQAQQLRREKQAEIKAIHQRLKDIHFELDRTPRGEDKSGFGKLIRKSNL